MQSGREQLRAWLTRMGFRQKQLAAQLGVTEVCVSQILSGERQPSLDLASSLEELTGIPARSFRLSRLSASSDLVAAGSAKTAKRSK